MTVYLKDGLPIRKELEAEGIEVGWKNQLPPEKEKLNLLIVNLMPTKDTTKKQLLRLIGKSPCIIDVDLLYMRTHQAKNVSSKYLDQYYQTFDSIKDNFYDGIIFTGAPVEQLTFQKVDYYEELVELFKWSDLHTRRRLSICWGAQFALNYQYGIEKELLAQKLFGVFEFTNHSFDNKLLDGFNNTYHIPHSSHTRLVTDQVDEASDLEVLTSHKDLGPDILQSKDGKDVYILGHLEYDRETLAIEFNRDLQKGETIHMPENYYPNDDPSKEPIFTWENSAKVFYGNWMNELINSKEVNRRSDFENSFVRFRYSW